MEVVGDTSAIHRLGQENLLQRVSATTLRIAVSDHYCARHQPNRTPEELKSLGLLVETLSPEALKMAVEHLAHDRGLSQCDAYALALAQVSSRAVITMEPNVRRRAEKAHIQCEDILSIFDVLEEEGAVAVVTLRQALLNLQGGHCRLPEKEIKIRLDRYDEALKGHILEIAAKRLEKDETSQGEPRTETPGVRRVNDTPLD